MSETLFPYRVFQLLAKTNSFTKTAQILNLANSSVSRTIQQLEQELNIELVQRSTRHIKLTNAGVIFLEEINAILNQIDNTKKTLLENSNSASGVVKITSPEYFAHQYIAPLIKDFNELYPNIKIIIDCTSKWLNLETSNYDIFIRAGKIHDSNFLVKRLFSYDYNLVASPKYIEKHPEIINAEQLKQHNLLVLQLNSAYHTWLLKYNDIETRLNPSEYSNLESNSTELILKAILNGTGVSLLPKPLVEPYIESGQLVSLLNKYKVTANHFQNNMYLLYNKQSLFLKKNKIVIDYLYEKLAYK
ncbi:LysR family transcriptional regulator [Francisella sp. 19X1-34]|uniref:LysR family transcriptional regulator n=1 Tax=Francisella sp. 19X1-34 TaxID=3087177 RepID=UPI002E2F4A12|nr:LysR family transcriptional regulator [Francisella sp. 19X1-34]MED7788162.1 LysR family transcriptional regulator [Francisella sp. 19X1-34]